MRVRSPEFVELLLEKKAKINAVNRKGDTALHLAMRARSKKVVEVLLRLPKNNRLLYKPNDQVGLHSTLNSRDMEFRAWGVLKSKIFGQKSTYSKEIVVFYE